MKRITAVLKESEAMAVRKAVCVDSVERVVLTPLPYRMCGADMLDISSEQRATERDKFIRLDVVAGDDRAGSIVAAIRQIARAGKIVLVSSRSKLLRLAA